MEARYPDPDGVVLARVGDQVTIAVLNVGVADEGGRRIDSIYARQARPDAATRSTAMFGAFWKQSVQSVLRPNVEPPVSAR